MSRKKNKHQASHFPPQVDGPRREGILRSLFVPLAFAALGCAGIAGSYVILTSLYIPDATTNETHLVQTAQERDSAWQAEHVPMQKKDHLKSQDKSWEPSESQETPADGTGGASTV